MDGHRAPRQGIPESRLIDLPEPAPDRDGVVFGYDPLGLYREDPVQVAPTGAPKRCAFLLRCHAEIRVELPDVALSQKRIGLIHRLDPRQPQFLWQAPLPGPETPLRPAP